MKKYLSILLCFFALSFFAQSQSLSLSEAVLGQSGALRPDGLRGLSWLPNQDNYVRQEGNSMFMGDRKGKEEIYFTLENLNHWSGLSLNRMPFLQWLRKEKSPTAWFELDGSIYKVTPSKETVAKTRMLLENGANTAPNLDASLVAYTIDNNLIVSTPTEQAKVTDKKPGIVSGQAIHRFEFGIGKGIFWSPYQSEKLAFYQKYEEHVTDYPLLDYTTVPGETELLKYPMAGQRSEYGRIGIYDAKTGTSDFLDINNNKLEDTYYVSNVSWSPKGEVYAVVSLRDQHGMYLAKWDGTTGKFIQKLIEEKSPKYIEPEHAAKFLPNGSGQFLWWSERNGYNHIYLYSENGELIRQVTSGDFPVTQFLGFDAKTKKIFVQATGENATERHLYSADLATGKMTKLTTEPGTHNVQLSSSGKYLIDQFSSLTVPNRITLRTTSGKKVKTLLEASNPLENRTIGTTELLQIEAKDGTKLWTRIIKPSNFDAKKKYPVLVYVYNGPHVQLIRNTWMAGAPLWMHSLAEDGFIVYTLDGRGSDNRGRDFEQAVYRQLGEMEMGDQLMGVNWLKAQPWVDRDKMAVHGWSFGGFMTTSLMMRRPGNFQVGVGGGPVTDWRMYEVMYTERYMDTPQTNPEGYKKADLKNYVQDLEGDLLLIHGTKDDVVLMQHSMSLIKECVDKGVQVDFFPYPGHPHNVRGKDRVHLMEKVLGYVKEKLDVEETTK